MKRRQLLTAAAGATMIGLAGCTSGEPMKEEKSGGEIQGIPDDIHRFIDCEAGVVCYWDNAGYGGGLSCVDLSETRFDYHNRC